MTNKVRIFTDGACSGNPGPGGWGAVVLSEVSYVVIGGSEKHTTNNRMELMAVIRAIMYAKQYGYTEIEVHADSAYVVNAIEKGWLNKWKLCDWKTVKGDNIKNIDLWNKLDELLNWHGLKIKLVKVKGHDGITFNEMADEEARRNSMIAKEALKNEEEELF